MTGTEARVCRTMGSCYSAGKRSDSLSIAVMFVCDEQVTVFEGSVGYNSLPLLGGIRTHIIVFIFEDHSDCKGDYCKLCELSSIITPALQ